MTDEQHDTALPIVRAWLEAVNAREPERVLALSDAEIEIVGPRGTAHGHAVLRQWMENARVSLESRRTFARGERVVVAQHGVWRSVETDETIGEADVASVFRVADGRVSYYARYDTLEEALDAAGLGAADETPV